MHQRVQMDHFNDGRHGDEAVVRSADGPGAQGHERRTQLLAVIRQGVLRVGADFRIESLHLLRESVGHRPQKRLHRLHNLLPGVRRLLGGRGDCNRFGFGSQHRAPNLRLAKNQVKPKSLSGFRPEV